MFTAAASKAAVDLTRALNAVQTGFVDAATAASLKAIKTITAAETVERKAVAKTNVVLAKDLQSAWGTYAAAECGAVILNARERATIGADYKKEVAGAELAAVKEVAPARKTSMVAAAEANGAYEVKVSAIVADLGILGGQIHVEQVKASQSLISPATLKKWLDSLSIWGETTAAFAKGLAQGVANLGNAVQDLGIGILNTPAASVNFGASVSETLFFDVPDHMKFRVPYIPSPDWSKGMVTQESDFDHGLSKGSLEVAVGIFGPGAIGRIRSAAAIGTMPLSAGKATGAYLPGAAGGGSGLGLFETHSVRVSQKGLELIRNHLSRFGDCEQNSMMMQRLRSAAADGCTISGADASFYMHEAAEATLMARGLSYPAAHAASLQKYGVSQYSVYHPSVVAALPQWFNKNWRNYWGMQ